MTLRVCCWHYGLSFTGTHGVRSHGGNPNLRWLETKLVTLGKIDCDGNPIPRGEYRCCLDPDKMHGAGDGFGGSDY